MLLVNERREVQSSGVLETARATIKATPKIFNFFADQTYANKPVAILRELVANGIDAHVMAGTPDRPVEVWLPTDLVPMFRCRDYGTGMSHEFMMTSYMAYTDGSTKDTSNNQIGGFGIGSKSPFAMVDQYTVRSVHDGVLSIYSVFKDEDGVPSIALLSQQDTDEPNGVEVSFPVAAEDILVFTEAAPKALSYFDPAPIVHNGHIEPPEYLATGKGWAIRQKSGELGIIMGGIRYPVVTANLSSSLRYDATISNLLAYGIDLIVPIGTCSVALSREGLSYDEQTEKGIKAALAATMDDIVKSFSTMFDECATLYDARRKLADAVGANNYGTSPRAKLLQNHAYWRGVKIETQFRVATGCKEHWYIDPPSYSRRRSAAPKKATWEVGGPAYLNVSNTGKLIIDDLDPEDHKSRAPSRVRHYLETNPPPSTHATWVMRPSADVKTLLNALGLPSRDQYVLTSELPLPPAQPRATGTARPRPKIRMYKLTRGTVPYNLRGRYDDSWAEIPDAEQPTQGLFVVAPDLTLPDKLRYMVSSGLLRANEFVIVGASDASKMTGFRNIDDVFKERVDARLTEDPNLVYRLGIHGNERLRDWMTIIGKQRQHIKLTPSQQRRPFGRLVELYDKYYNTITPADFHLSQFVTPKMPPRINAAKLISLLETEQWQLVTVRKLLGYNLTHSTLKVTDNNLKLFVEQL